MSLLFFVQIFMGPSLICFVNKDNNENLKISDI